MRRAAKPALACLATLALAGCASTPQEIVQQGPRSEHTLQLPPFRAAGCIARNAENLVDSINAPIRPLESGERYEVVIRSIGNDLYPILLIGILEPMGNGSRVTFHGPGYRVSPPRHEFIASLAKGC